MAIIRKANIRDVKAIGDLDAESVEYHKKFDKGFYAISKRWLDRKKSSLIKAIKSGNSLVLVAESNKRVVGYVWGHISMIGDEKLGVVQELTVSDKERRKKIGEKLTGMLLTFFKSKGCTAADLHVLAKNKIAISFYEKMGFKTDSHLMRLKFSRRFSPFSS